MRTTRTPWIDSASSPVRPAVSSWRPRVVRRTTRPSMAMNTMTSGLIRKPHAVTRHEIVSIR